jgi:transcription initiation factor TFIIA small subunit
MANPAQNYYELYRSTSIGQTLADTLDDLISSRRIEPQLAMKVMQNFDQNIANVLGEKVKARLSFKVCPLTTLLAAWYHAQGVGF